MSVKWHHWLVAGCINLSIGGHALASGHVTVFAAASLTNALQDIASQYEKGRAVKIVSSFASSSTLARQLEQGAPADMFISADQQWMDYVAGKHAIDNASRVNLLGNDLVLIAPTEANPQPVSISKSTDWKSLLKDQRLAVGDPDHVPAGMYAKEALENLGAWRQLSPLMARGNSVRAALALVERDETPYGIVYGSDAVASKKVKVVGIFPQDSHRPVEYPLALVKGRNNASAGAFYHYLQGPQAAVIFKQYGFTTLK
ncbi:molybdate ABC transport system, periplasmic protein precursor [Erwinia amylovora Ea644]|nr:molybdate ABC transport system, periplasmic protein precursor [Erwinia amylovora Ea644]